MCLDLVLEYSRSFCFGVVVFSVFFFFFYHWSQRGGQTAGIPDLFVGVIHQLLHSHPVETALSVLPAGRLPHLHGLRRHQVLLPHQTQVLLPVVHRHLVLVGHLPTWGYASPPLLPAHTTRRGQSDRHFLKRVCATPNCTHDTQTCFEWVCYPSLQTPHAGDGHFLNGLCYSSLQTGHTGDSQPLFEWGVCYPSLQK